jgi:WhiB family transcriptional regulator, redox-sensing transcriptional regulator
MGKEAPNTIPYLDGRAACRDVDPDLFFPVGKSGPALLQIDEAKQVCRRCPVLAECLTWALERPKQQGVCGGTTEDERAAVRRGEIAVPIGEAALDSHESAD